MVRKAKNKKKNKQAEKDLKQKLGLFDQLPEECLACAEPFDRENREQVMSWNVVVKRDPDVVRLYCPDCWSKAVSVVQDFDKRIRERAEPDNG
jgi:Zn finger protein HypA/HybF involved in hydrogenase expression